MPRVTLVTRKTYGGAYIAMNSRALGATRVFAWPGAEVAVMGAVAAVRILHRRKLAEVAPEIRPQVEAELAAEHERLAGGVDKAVEIGVVDEVVEPAVDPLGASPRAIAGPRHATAAARQHPALGRARPTSARAASRRRRLRAAGSRPTVTTASDDVVQPAHGRALAGVAERLELVVPRLAEQLVDLGRAAWCRRGRP